MTTDDSAKAGALLEDYKLKAGFHGELTNRVQTQFQVMLTLESALATALIVSNTGDLTKGAPFIALLELALSIAWVMVGKAGRDRLRIARAAVENAGVRWAAAAGLPEPYEPVAHGPPIVRVAVIGPVLVSIGWLALFVVFLTETT